MFDWGPRFERGLSDCMSDPLTTIRNCDSRTRSANSTDRDVTHQCNETENGKVSCLSSSTYSGRSEKGDAAVPNVRAIKQLDDETASGLKSLNMMHASHEHG